ncbi:hypothetical protein SLE2022_312730 [Rubroshorea leprosula]
MRLGYGDNMFLYWKNPAEDILNGLVDMNSNSNVIKLSRNFCGDSKEFDVYVEGMSLAQIKVSLEKGKEYFKKQKAGLHLNVQEQSGEDGLCSSDFEFEDKDYEQDEELDKEYISKESDKVTAQKR